jgi:hypothetical protein
LNASIPFTEEAQPFRVRAGCSPLHPAHRLEIVLVEEQPHVVLLLGPDPVLPGEHPARIHADAQDLPSDGAHALELLGIALIEGDVGVQIPVPGVQDVGDADAARLGGPVDPVDHLGQARAGNDRIVHVEVGREASHRAERPLASAPEREPLRLITRHAHLDGAVLGTACLHPLALRRDRLGRAVQLDEQHGAGVTRIAGGEDRVLDGLNGAVVHHLEGGRNDAGRDDRRDRLAGRNECRKARQQRAHALGERSQAHRRRRDDPDGSLGADEDPAQVVAERVAILASEGDDGAVGQHDLQRQHVGAGRAVLERVRAAAVLGDVPADRAGRLAGGVGRIVQAERGHRLGEVRVDQARLHRGGGVDGVDREDSVHARALDQHAAIDGGSASGETRARSARHERHTRLEAGTHRTGHALGPEGEHDRGGPAAQQRQAVRLVDEQIPRSVEDLLDLREATQPGDECGCRVSQCRGARARLRRGRGSARSRASP